MKVKKDEVERSRRWGTRERASRVPGHHDRRKPPGGGARGRADTNARPAALRLDFCPGEEPPAAEGVEVWAEARGDGREELEGLRDRWFRWDKPSGRHMPSGRSTGKSGELDGSEYLTGA